MVYRFLLLSDEVENFERIIEIDSEATFIDFRDVILKSVGYTNSNLTTFYICSEDWEKEQETRLRSHPVGSGGRGLRDGFTGHEDPRWGED